MLLNLKARDGDLLLITEPALLTMTITCYLLCSPTEIVTIAAIIYSRIQSNDSMLRGISKVSIHTMFLQSPLHSAAHHNFEEYLVPHDPFKVFKV